MDWRGSYSSCMLTVRVLSSCVSPHSGFWDSFPRNGWNVFSSLLWSYPQFDSPLYAPGWHYPFFIFASLHCCCCWSSRHLLHFDLRDGSQTRKRLKVPPKRAIKRGILPYLQNMSSGLEAPCGWLTLFELIPNKSLNKALCSVYINISCSLSGWTRIVQCSHFPWKFTITLLLTLQKLLLSFR